MIAVITGSPGAGKGVFAMTLLEQLVSTGRPVLTNITLSEACPFHNDVGLLSDDQVMSVGKGGGVDQAFWHFCPRGSAVVLDEADVWFDCSDHTRMAAEVRLFLKQHRKWAMDVFFIVQRLENLYVRIRRLAQRFIVCEWTWRSFRALRWLEQVLGTEGAMRWSRFVRAEFGDEDLRDLLDVSYIRYDDARRYFAWYETDQIVGAGGLGKRVEHGER